MGNFFDIGYFKNSNLKIKRSNLAKKRNIKNKILAWKLDKEYYDGQRINGYGGFRYDGRWKKFIPSLIKKYKLNKNSKILEIGCKKGFFLKDLQEIIPGIKCYGIENHEYPLKKTILKNKKNLILSEYYKVPFKKHYFDFVLGFNSIYMQNLGDVIKTLREISRVSKNSYISLASGESAEDIIKFQKWTLLGTTILKKKEWKLLFKKINFKGDFYFSEAKKLKL